MVSRVSTLTFIGNQALLIDVQVHFANGLPGIKIVGLPGKVVDESKERIRAALGSMKILIPNKRITVNLSPADCQKSGSHYDLPILLAILAEMNLIAKEKLQNKIVMGEVSLDAQLTKINGVLPAALHAKNNNCELICPIGNAQEAVFAELEEEKIIAVENLQQLIDYFQEDGGLPLLLINNKGKSEDNNHKYIDFAEIKGHFLAKRVLQIAALGGHNVLMIGSPGVGKSMLAEAFAGIVPDLNKEDLLENSVISSLSGCFDDNISPQVPFRAPHHSCSMQAMIGGGRTAKPGEITLANKGVLFLDEFPEFPRVVLDSLRQSLETGTVSIARVDNHITYPAAFQLIGAMNPCRCGFALDPNRSCKKVPFCMQDYMQKISGPLLDRFDLILHVENENDLFLKKSPENQENSLQIKQKLATLREQQISRLAKIEEKFCKNARVSGELLEKIAPLDEQCQKFLQKALQKFQLSFRGQKKILKVARTIADFEDSEQIEVKHLQEALIYKKEP